MAQATHLQKNYMGRHNFCLSYPAKGREQPQARRNVSNMDNYPMWKTPWSLMNEDRNRPTGRVSWILRIFDYSLVMELYAKCGGRKFSPSPFLRLPDLSYPTTSRSVASSLAATAAGSTFSTAMPSRIIIAGIS